MTVSDAEKNNSTLMNQDPADSATIHNNGVRVVFIGNSITLHRPLAEIGWSGNHGMAASSPENDYVHIVTRGIEKMTGRKADVRVKNLAAFERNYKNYDFSKEQDLVDFRPEYLIVALGENVPELENEEDRLEYRDAFKKLLECFMYGRAKPATVVRGVFWENSWKDKMMAHAASDLALVFVEAALAGDNSMKAIGLFEHEGVQKHPGDKGMAEIAARILEGLFPQNSGYSVQADGNNIPVQPIRISAMPFNQWAPGYQRPVEQTEIAGMARLEIDSECSFIVKTDRRFTTAKVRPLRFGIKPEIKGNEIHFSIPGPGYYVLELDGYHRPLEIFADPKRDFSRERAEANIVFGPGIHAPVTVRLKDHDRVYIDRDAVVFASFQADNVKDVKISGCGIISGSRNRRVGNNCYRDGMDIPILIVDSEDVIVDGPTVLDSCCWCVAAFNSKNIELANLKVTGAWRYNTDGIDICNSQHVYIHDCYVHSFDDTIVIKGIYPPAYRNDPVEDIKIERCTCWCGWGRTLEIGLETWAPYFKGITFQDCDLIHNEAAALSVHMGGPAPLEDIIYKNIRIEYDASEMRHVLQKERDQAIPDFIVPYSGEWLNVANVKMFTSSGMYKNRYDFDPDSEPNGTLKKLTVENIEISVDEGACIPSMSIYSASQSMYSGIRIKGVSINGRSLDEIDYL